ncbi:MAG: SLBB domain-containing protein [Elainella sp. Prado103]|nr:SLBB domain-containing protein [Elainella sp. Prado103]
MSKTSYSCSSWACLGLSTLFFTTGCVLPGYAQEQSTIRQQQSSDISVPPLQTLRQIGDTEASESWSDHYRLGPGDVIKIDVFGAEEYSGEAIVLQDGAIGLPRGGRVFVQGQTFQQAAESIAGTYTTYIRNPLITITPIKLRPIRIAISGEVNHPGSYTVESTQNNQEQKFPTLTQIIAQAGGITARANLKKIEIRRPVGSDQAQVATINLWNLVQSSDLSQDIVLQSGDEVHVPTAANLSAQELTELASANFAPPAIRVYVAGEVARPGLIEVPLNTPLNQAILVAGGFNERADRDSVNLVRLNPNGTITKQDVEIDFNEGVNEENNPILMNQDVVVVERSVTADFSQVAGMVLSPLSQILNTILGFRGLFR